MTSTHVSCTVCQGPLTSDPEMAGGVCVACAAKLGISAMPPSRRPPAPCQRCNHTSFVRAIPRELSVVTGMGEQNNSNHAPMFVTYQPQMKPRLFGGEKLGELDPATGCGLVEMYICRACGFLEWYCHDPTEIPIGPQYMTELVDYGSAAPYR